MIKNKKIFSLKLIIFEIIFIISLFGIYKYIYIFQQNRLIEEIIGKETAKVKTLKQLILNYFEMTWSNMDILSSSKELTAFVVDEDNNVKREKSENILKNWLIHNKLYENIDIIKTNGTEIMKVNSNNGLPLSVLLENLVSKKNEDYFKKISSINSNEFSMFVTAWESTENNIQTKFIFPIFINKSDFDLMELTISTDKIIKKLSEQLGIAEESKIYIFDSEKNKIFGEIERETLENSLKDINNKNLLKIFYKDRINIEETLLNKKVNSGEEKYWEIFAALPSDYFETLSDSKLQILKWQYYFFQILGIVFIYLFYLTLYKKNETEEELKISGEVLKNAKEGIIITDNKQQIIYANLSYIKMLEYTKDEILQKKINEIKSNRHSKEFYKKMWSVINKYGKWQGEIWGKKKGGEYFPVWLTISKVNMKRKNTRYIAIYDDLSILKRNEESIRNLMDFDFITHLPNKFLFMDRLQQLMSQARVLKEKFTVISLSIDNLKQINANFGMETGDQFLKKFTLILKEKLTPADTLAKFNGSNLYILLPEIQTPTKALEKTEEILSINKKSIKIGNSEIIAYLNIGVIIYPDNGETLPELMKNLGFALNASKQEGGNNFKFYSNEIHHLAMERSEMDISLRRAIENKEFYLSYQPQIDVKSGKIIGAEALIRWQHPVLGLITPVKFIPIAEENKFINTIGEWVIKEACLQNKAWRTKGYENLIVAVNISPVQFSQDNFIDLLKKVLAETELEAKYLEIELTEGMMVQDMEAVMKKLKEIKKLGVKISIDDFGTGYSSLSYIKKFPIDKIKIDRIFIKDFPSGDDGRIAKTIVQLGHNLNYRVIAEGAENKEQYEYLKSINCDEIQGYYFSKPLSSVKFEEKYLKNI